MLHTVVNLLLRVLVNLLYGEAVSQTHPFVYICVNPITVSPVRP